MVRIYELYISIVLYIYFYEFQETAIAALTLTDLWYLGNIFRILREILEHKFNSINFNFFPLGFLYVALNIIRWVLMLSVGGCPIVQNPTTQRVSKHITCVLNFRVLMSIQHFILFSISD
jgi:hypothetical protein